MPRRPNEKLLWRHFTHRLVDENNVEFHHGGYVTNTGSAPAGVSLNISMYNCFGFCV